MLTCITCSKQQMEERGGEEGARGAPTSTATKEALKSLTAQIKDMAMKFSGACKPCTGSGSSSTTTYKQRPYYPHFDSIVEGVPYPLSSFPPAVPGTSNSTPGNWDFTSNVHHPTSQLDSPFNGQSRSGGGGGLAHGGGVVTEVGEEDNREWLAQVEPGVQITFMSLPNGGNDLKRIRFSREMFNKWEAQRWWGENYDRIMELYNVQTFDRQALHTPPRSQDDDDGRDSSYSRLGLGSARESPMTPSLNKEWTPRNYNKPSASKAFSFPSDSSDQGGGYNSHYNAASGTFYDNTTGGVKAGVPPVDAPRTTTSSRDEASISVSNASDVESEWVEQDEPGIYITVRQLADGTRELRRVRFSRERFGEMHAKLWWEQNRERIQEQYL